LIDFITQPLSGNLDVTKKKEMLCNMRGYISIAFKRMPWSSGIPVLILGWLFKVIPFLIYFKSFNDLADSQKTKFIIFWISLGKPFESFIRLYRSLAFLVFYEKYQEFSIKKIGREN
jgi:hypothetical protein